MRKLTSVFVCLCLLAVLLTNFPVTASESAMVPDTSWYDASKNEYTISTPEQLLGIKTVMDTYILETFSGKVIKLENNIVLNTGDASQWKTTPPANAWTPIGTAGNPFQGTFDGNGYTICGLYVNEPTKSYMGMFSYASGATFKNISLTNSYIYGKEAVGSLVGRVNAKACTFSDIYVGKNVYVEGINSWVGGVCGSVLGNAVDTKFERCSFAGFVTANSVAGGILGYDYQALPSTGATGTHCEIIDCANYGTITTKTDRSGGIIGAAFYSKLTRCLNAGPIVTPAIGGGLIGKVHARYVSMENCYTCTDVLTGVADKAGNTVGEYHSSSYPVLTATETTTNAIKGKNAKNVLTMLDFNTIWSAVYNELPALKSTLTLMAKAAGKTFSVMYKAVQESAVSDNQFNVRFIATVDALGYEKVGFEIVAYYSEGGTQQTKTYNVNCTHVYNKLIGNTATGISEYTADELGGKFLMALSIKNIPANIGSIVFEVTPYYESGAVSYYGTTYVVTYENGIYQDQMIKQPA